jgi:hypothetical protein
VQKDLNEALAVGIKLSKTYCGKPYTNVFGQKVTRRMLSRVRVFDLMDPPSEGGEVYSATNVISKKMSDATIVTARFGSREFGDVGDTGRISFIDWTK